MKHISQDIQKSTEEWIRNMPKIELHLHLEGAIPLFTLFRLIERSGGDPTIETLADLERKFTYTNFDDFIRNWVWKNTFIKCAEDFEMIAYEVLQWLYKQNIKYVEAFYSPGDYRRQGLSVQEITEAIISGCGLAYRDFGIKCNLLVDLIRDHGPDVGMKRLDDVMPYLGKGVIGIGLGGSEHAFPPEPYEAVYKEAKQRGFRLTAHAGEVSGASSIWSAIEKLGVERLGHGTRAYEDPDLLLHLKKRQIPLEVCVTSNVKLGVCPSLQAHPIKSYVDRGLCVTINSDDPMMFQSSLTDEYLMLTRELEFTPTEIKRLSMNAITASFLPESDKHALMQAFECDWQKHFFPF